MADENYPDSPRFEPYISMPMEHVLRLRDMERLIYQNPHFFNQVMAGADVESDFAEEARGHIDFVLNDVDEVIPFDEATEDALYDNLSMRDLLDKRKSATTEEERTRTKQELLKTRLGLFVRRIIELHDADDSGKIKPFPVAPEQDDGAKTGGGDGRNIA